MFLLLKKESRIIFVEATLSLSLHEGQLMAAIAKVGEWFILFQELISLSLPRAKKWGPYRLFRGGFVAALLLHLGQHSLILAGWGLDALFYFS